MATPVSSPIAAALANMEAQSGGSIPVMACRTTGPCSSAARRTRSAAVRAPSGGRDRWRIPAAARNALLRARAGLIIAATSPATRPGTTRAATASTVRSRTGEPGTGANRGSSRTRSTASDTRGPYIDMAAGSCARYDLLRTNGVMSRYMRPAASASPLRCSNGSDATPTDRSHCAMATRIADIPWG
jgi:hypothetical protein